MITGEKFGIIGGDMRQFYMAQSLITDLNEVKIFGFDKINNEFQKNESNNLIEIIEWSDYIIFPLPLSRDNQTVNAPFSSIPIKINDELYEMLKNKKMFGGIISHLKKYIKNNKKFQIFDYYSREDFKLLNALPTAEGAIKTAYDNYKKIIKGSICLVTGFGRIGKVLTALLKNIGAEVSVSARKESDLAEILTLGYTPIDIVKADENVNFDIVFNTVPVQILTEKILSLFNKDTLLIELASAPGGIDKSAAENLGLKFINAPGLPGKYFPQSAGEIIKNTIYKIIKEEAL